jgi:flavin reductase (DIM6/NTAB) family NADH-FMN oxidoreductase RutF|tara:strand:- start:591 stop:1457 length:867 start_codon:yes stop_codon:yes gene_type:complete
VTKFQQFDPNKLELREKHQLLLSSVAPRPIGFTGSKSKDGHINLAPFSYHNAFSSNPPMVGISPAFSGRTGKTKNTLTNILDTKEFTLSVVTHDMVEQMNICAAEYPKEVDEFEKSGLTKYPCKIVSTPGVEESPLIMECKFTQHIQFSDKPAGGNLLLGEIVYFHAKKDIINDSGKIDPIKVDQVARMGFNWYTRANQGLFELPAPRFIPIGVDSLPQAVRKHPSFSGKLLARLAYVESIPNENTSDEIREKYSQHSTDELFQSCAKFLEQNKIEEAWVIIHFYLSK